MAGLVLGDDPMTGQLQSEWDLDAFSFQLPKNSIRYGIRITAATPGVQMTATVHADNDRDNGRYKTLSVRDGGDVTVYVRHNKDNPHSNWTGRFQVRLHPENEIDGNGRYTVSLVNGQIRDVPTDDDHPDGTGHDRTETLHEGGSVSGFISDAQDQDFFKLESGLQGSFSLELELPPAVTRIIYFLHSASGEYASALPDLPVNIDTTTEDWYVLVHSHDPEARTEYTITLDRLDDPDDPGELEEEEEEEEVDLEPN